MTETNPTWNELDSAERIGLGLFDNMDGTYSSDAVAMQSKTATRLLQKGLVRPDPSGDVPPGRNRTYVYLTDEGRALIASTYDKEPHPLVSMAAKLIK